MKQFILILVLLFGKSVSGLAQKIDNSNYYAFQNKHGNVNWLRPCDAIPVIMDELLKNNIPYHLIRVGELVKLNDSTRLVVTISFTKGDKNYGFVFEEGHDINLDPEDRVFLATRKKDYYYNQPETDAKGNLTYRAVHPVPDNIQILKETWYWFQYDDHGTEFPVSKETARQILRQDVADFLKSI